MNLLPGVDILLTKTKKAPLPGPLYLSINRFQVITMTLYQLTDCK